MNVSSEQQRRIRRILRTLTCPHRRPCHEPRGDPPGDVQPVGDTGLLVCLESRGRSCEFALHFGGAVFCECRLRKYLVGEGIQ
jgi:hypothetical protein